MEVFSNELTRWCELGELCLRYDDEVGFRDKVCFPIRYVPDKVRVSILGLLTDDGGWFQIGSTTNDMQQWY